MAECRIACQKKNDSNARAEAERFGISLHNVTPECPGIDKTKDTREEGPPALSLLKIMKNTKKNKNKNNKTNELAGGPFHLPSANNVDVQVEHRLAAILPIIHDEAEPVGALFVADSTSDEHEVP
mmetsp:Transcript_10300/g.15422  ORF Transcript_10300/g.15422 Transcript_10300/m.15422 type:complete len:125 (-) Transcript_10300:200-574(-)